MRNLDRLVSLFRGPLWAGLSAVALLGGSAPALAGPVFAEPAAWNQPVSATAGGWWTTSDGGVTIAGKPNGDFPTLEIGRAHV